MACTSRRTFSPETFLAEDPDIAEKVGLNYDGSQTIYFAQYFRWQWCYSQASYVDYMKKTIDKAIAIGADLLHFDNYNWMPDLRLLPLRRVRASVPPVCRADRPCQAQAAAGL